MDNLQLEGRIIESVEGRNIDTAPALLVRHEKDEGVISSEADIRLLGVRNFKNSPKLVKNYWDTSTLSAIKGETVKVILPYETGSKTLTEAARFGLSLINSNEDLVHHGIDLDIDDRWEKYCNWTEKDGVYTKQRDEWFENRKKGVLVGLNSDMTKEEAEKCPLLLTKLQHPDYVDSKFAMSRDEVAEIIDRTFKLGFSEHLMGQYLPDVRDKGVLNAWCVSRFYDFAGSNANADVGEDGGRFAFDIVEK